MSPLFVFTAVPLTSSWLVCRSWTTLSFPSFPKFPVPWTALSSLKPLAGSDCGVQDETLPLLTGIRVEINGDTMTPACHRPLSPGNAREIVEPVNPDVQAAVLLEG